MLYYKRKVRDEVDLMKEIQDLYEKHSFLGYRRITEIIRRNSTKVVNHKKVLRLMQKMGLQAVYPKKNLSKKAEGHKVYSYLLRDNKPQKSNDCWSVDITYIKVCGCYVYLTGIIDWVSRRIMGWSLSPFLEASSCLEALEESLKTATPKIVNTDQGSQFTSQGWIELLRKNEIEISMDGKGRCLDNIRIERFWRALKYEEIYLKSYDSMIEARKNIEQYIDFYNKKRPHQNLEYKTPEEVYCEKLEEGVPPPLAIGL